MVQQRLAVLLLQSRAAAPDVRRVRLLLHSIGKEMFHEAVDDDDDDVECWQWAPREAHGSFSQIRAVFALVVAVVVRRVMVELWCNNVLIGERWSWSFYGSPVTPFVPVVNRVIFH